MSFSIMFPKQLAPCDLSAQLLVLGSSGPKEDGGSGSNGWEEKLHGANGDKLCRGSSKVFLNLGSTR